METSKKQYEEMLQHVARIIENQNAASINERNPTVNKWGISLLGILVGIVLLLVGGPLLFIIFGFVPLFLIYEKFSRFLKTQKKKDLIKNTYLPKVASYFGTVSYTPPNFYNKPPMNANIKSRRQHVEKVDILPITHDHSYLSPYARKLVDFDYLFVDEYLAIDGEHTSWELWDLILAQKTESDRKKHIHCLYAFMESKAPIKETLIIKHDQKHFLPFLKPYKQLFKLETDTLEQVHLEAPYFEERYDVYSTNQLFARTVLTPDMMETLSHITNDCIFLLNPKGIHILTVTEGDNFEPSSTDLSPKELHLYCNKIGTDLLAIHQALTFIRDHIR